VKVDGSNAAGWRTQTRMALVLLFLLMVVDYADRQVMVAAFPYVRLAWGLSDVQLGALVSVVSVVVAAAALPIAVAVDRWGRVRAVAVMAVVWSAATAACGFAGGYLSLLAARFVVGLGQAGYGPAGSALLAAKFPAERRASVLGVFQTGAPVGIVVGGVGGSLAAAQWGWRAAFWVVALPGLVLAVLFLRVGDYPTVRPARPGVRATGRALMGARSAVGAMAGGALLLVVLSTLYTWLPTYLQRVYGMAPARAGVLGSVVVLAGAVGTAGGAVLADRAARRDVRRRLVVPAAAAVLTSALLGTAFLALPAGAAQLLLVLAGAATVTAAVGPAAAAVLDTVEPGLRATAISVFVLVQNLFGLAIGPVLTGAMADRWGLTFALGMVAGLGLPAALALYSGSRSYHRDRTQAGSPPPAGLGGGAEARSNPSEPAGSSM